VGRVNTKGDDLAYTGASIIIPLILGIVIIAAGVGLFFATRRRNHKREH
jgi:LPXTG-motif cell wall-anchored protein